MKITAIKTEKLSPRDKDKPTIEEFVGLHLDSLNEGAIVAVTSKIVSILEGRYADGSVDKDELARKEADRYYQPTDDRYCKVISLKNNLIMPASGIDESNSDGYYILLPKDPFKSAKKIRKHLVDQFGLKKLGVVITDTKTNLLRRGTTGVSIGYAGFSWDRDYVGKPDLFNREMKITKANLVDGLASGAVMEMGEGKESTPIAIIEEIDRIKFSASAPTKAEIEDFWFKPEEDIYYDLFKGVDWKKNKKN